MLLILEKKHKIDIPSGNLVKKNGKTQTYKLRKDRREITIVKTKINRKWTSLQNVMQIHSKPLKYFTVYENVIYRNRPHLIQKA